jgi:hypothetical protein
MLSKLLLFSVVVSTVMLPVLAARDRLPRRGLKRAIVWVVAFNAFYLFALRVIYPRL